MATGYNGFPRGVADLPGRLLDRKEKLLRTVHAEANIISQCARYGISLEQATVYIWPFLPCASCCTLLIQTGIKRIVTPDTPIPDRWEESFSASLEMLREAGIDLVIVSD